MDEERAEVTTRCRNYLIARQNYWDNETDRALEEQWLRASDKWTQTQRHTTLSKREVREVADSVLAELATVL